MANNLYRSDGWVKSPLGQALSGAQVYVCNQPANTTWVPPSPLANTFSDPSGLVPITQPIISDGFGHYSFYAVPGLYTVVVVTGGRVQQVYPDQSLGSIGTNGTTGLLAGSGITIIPDNLGNTTISTLGAVTEAAVTSSLSNGQVIPYGDAGISRLGAAALAIGNGTAGDYSGTLKSTIINAVTGYQLNGAATTGHVLRGNGTNFVDAQLSYSDLGGSAPVSGVWQRQGTIITPLAGEFGVEEPNVIYEGSPQLLTHVTTNVFKMWFSNGWLNPGIFYAESVDGINWVRKSTAVVAVGQHAGIVKNGSTYYLYVAPVVAGASTTLELYTATDGVTFAHIGTMLSCGAGWDSTQIANPCVFLETNGTTWAMMYDGWNGSGGWKTGLATATSPSGPWTKYGTSPVVTSNSGAGTTGSFDVHIVNGVYYAWEHGTDPVTGTGVVPSDFYFWSSPDLHTWTYLAPVMFRETPDEGANVSTAGQIADPNVVYANGSTYLFYDGTASQAGTGEMHIKCLTSTGTIAQLVSSTQSTVGTGLDSGWVPVSNAGLAQGGSTVEIGKNGLYPVSLTAQKFVNQDNVDVAILGLNYSSTTGADIARQNTSAAGMRLQMNSSTTLANNAMFMSMTDLSGTNYNALVFNPNASGVPTVTGLAKFAIPLLWDTDNTYDIGASGGLNRPRTGYFGTSVVTPTIIGLTTLSASTSITTPLDLFSMPGQTQVASDAFAGSSLSGSWTTQAGLGSFIVSSGVVKGNTTGVQYAWWNANSLTNDQYCTAVVASLSSNGIGPCVRVSAFGGYTAYYQTGHQYLFKFDGVGGNTLLSSASAPSVNDVVGISAVGTTITVTINGVAVITVTDSTFSSGAAGVWAYQQTTLTSGLKTWAAGNVSTFTAGISQLGAASLAVGNGTAGDTTGSLTLGALVATAAAPTVAAAQIGYGSTTSATVGAAGAAAALPATPTGYIVVNIAGTAMKVPYYAS